MVCYQDKVYLLSYGKLGKFPAEVADDGVHLFDHTDGFR